MSKNSKLLKIEKTVTLKGKSLFIFSTNNRLRIILSKLVVDNIFGMFIFMAVLFYSIFMVFEDPLSDTDRKSKTPKTKSIF